MRSHSHLPALNINTAAGYPCGIRRPYASNIETAGGTVRYLRADARQRASPGHIVPNPLKEWNKGVSWRGCHRSKPPRFVQAFNRIWYKSARRLLRRTAAAA